jgi:tetratricopeptide (TPR) repeat protein
MWTGRVTPVVLAVVLGVACGKPPYHEHLERAESLLDKDPAAAAVEYQKAIEQGAAAQGNAGLGLALERLGKLQQALVHLNQAKQQAPNDLGVRLALGRIHVIRGQPKLARPELLFVVNRKPDAIPAMLLVAAIADSADTAAVAETRLNRVVTEARDQGQPLPLEAVVALSDLAVLQKNSSRAKQLQEELPRAKLLGTKLAATLARVYARRRRYEPAAQLLQAAAQAESKPLELWLELARVALAHAELGDAEEALGRAAAASKGDPRLLRLRADLHSARGQHARAAAVLGQAVQALPAGDQRRPAWQLARAKAFITAGDETGALRALEEQLKAKAPLVRTRVALGALLIKRKKTREARGVLEPAVREKTAPPEAFQLLAAAQFAQGDAKQARATLESLVKRAPKQPIGYVMLGAYLRDRGDRAGALAQFQKALQQDPESMAALRGLAQLQAKGDQGQDAAAKMLRTRAKQAKHPWRHIQLLGELYQDWGRPVEAVDAYEESLKLRPARPKLWLTVARLNLVLKNRPAAIQAARQAVEYSGQRDIVGLALLARLLREDGRPEEARRTYEAMLKRDPKSVVALNNLAMLYAGPLRQIEPGLKVAERAYQVAPGNPGVADTLGWLLCQRGKKQDLQRSVELLQQAAANLNAADVRFHLGMAQIKAGQVAEGKQNLRKALSLSRDFDGAEEARAALGQPG